jgi:hypothetical protein
MQSGEGIHDMLLPIYGSMFLWQKELACPVTTVKSLCQETDRFPRVLLTGTALR